MLHGEGLSSQGCDLGIAGNIELLATGRLLSTFWDWESGRTFRFTRDTSEAGEANENANSSGDEADGKRTGDPLAREGDDDFRASDLAIPFALAAADGLRSAFTNYTEP